MVTKKQKKLFLFHDTSPLGLEIGVGGRGCIHHSDSEIQRDGCSISTHVSMLTSAGRKKSTLVGKVLPGHAT